MIPYRIMAEIVDEIDQHMMDTRDTTYLAGKGVDVLVTIARGWMRLGGFDAAGTFCIRGPAKPDGLAGADYDDMAATAFDTAITWLDWLCLTDRQAWQQACTRLHLTNEEKACWLIAADSLRSPSPVPE